MTTNVYKLTARQQFDNWLDTVASILNPIFFAYFALDCARHQRNGIPKLPHKIERLHDGTDPGAIHCELWRCGVPTLMWSNRWMTNETMISDLYVPGAQGKQAQAILRAWESGKPWRDWGVPARGVGIHGWLQKQAAKSGGHEWGEGK